eukprot:s1038_g10.t1
MTFQDLCKLRAVNKDVKGSLCRSHWHWHSAATRALPDFDLNPALFLGAALQRCFQVMPLLLRLTSAQHYTMPPMPRSVRGTPQRVVLQDHKIAVRCEADGLALAKRVEMQLQVAKTHLEGGGHFAKIFITQMGSSIGEHASIIVLKDCQPIFSPELAATPGRGNSAHSAHLYVMCKKGKISMAIRSKAGKVPDANTGDSQSGTCHVLLDFIGMDGSDLLVHCRNVLLRMNGPWTEAQGLCLLSARCLTSAVQRKGDAARGMSCILCLRNAKAPPVDESGVINGLHVGTARCAEALHMDNLAAWHCK